MDMTSKHTPGEVAASVAMIVTMIDIAKDNGLNMVKCPTDRMSVARDLVAAAPALLEQLAKLRQHMVDVFNAEPLDEDTRQVLAEADAVIAQAVAS